MPIVLCEEYLWIFLVMFVLRIEQMATRNKMLFPDVQFCEFGARDPE